jgi:predicted small secreted protein
MKKAFIIVSLLLLLSMLLAGCGKAAKQAGADNHVGAIA